MCSNKNIVIQSKSDSLFVLYQAMDSSNVSEDGASERVRFDNNLYFSVNSKDSIEKVNSCGKFVSYRNNIFTIISKIGWLQCR